MQVVLVVAVVRPVTPGPLLSPGQLVRLVRGLAGRVGRRNADLSGYRAPGNSLGSTQKHRPVHLELMNYWDHAWLSMLPDNPTGGGVVSYGAAAGPACTTQYQEQCSIVQEQQCSTQYEQVRVKHKNYFVLNQIN